MIRLLAAPVMAVMLLSLSPAWAQTPEARSPAPVADPAQPGAGSGAAPLTLREVLASVDRHYPLLEAAQQDVAAAQGAAQEAEGGFDLSWRSRATLAPLGYYNNMRLDSIVELPTQLWGLRAYGGWRLGDGSFPVYDGKLQTNNRGEARAGLFLPILRGGSTDRRRTELEVTNIGIAAAQAGVAEKRIEYARASAQRYWSWVAAGQRLQITRTLLALAVERDAGIATRAARGDLSEIERTDNARAILKRQAQLVAAERSLAREGYALSLYLRSPDGQPLVPPAERLPTAFPEPTELSGSPRDKADQAVSRRPEIARLQLQGRQLSAQRALHRNDRLPGLDLQVGVSQDFGTGSPTREPAELEVSVLLDIPIQNRTARGKLAQTEAKLAKNAAETRMARDRVEVEVRDAMNAVNMAFRGVAIARREVELARRLEQAERQRFDLGASSILVVALREQASFDAAQREVGALAEYQVAHAAYRAALTELDPLRARPDGAPGAASGLDRFLQDTPDAAGEPRTAPELAAEVLLHLRQQLGGVERLDQVVGAAALEAHLDARRLISRGHHDDRDGLRDRVIAKLAAGGDARHARHHEVHQDEIGLVLDRLGDRLEPIARGDHLVGSGVEHHPCQRLRGGRIIGDQDLLHCHGKVFSLAPPGAIRSEHSWSSGGLPLPVGLGHLGSEDGRARSAAPRAGSALHALGARCGRPGLSACSTESAGRSTERRPTGRVVVEQAAMRSLRPLLGLLVPLLIASACEAPPPNVPPAPPPPPPPVATTPPPPPGPPAVEVTLEQVGLDSTALDRSAQPCDDFYQFACGGWMSKAQIPDDKAKWSRSFSEIYQRNEADLRGILEAAVKAPEGPIKQKLGGYYGACMDTAAIDKAGAKPIQKLLEKAQRVRNAKTLGEAIVELHKERIWPLFDISDDQDFKDATRVIASLDQSGLGLPDRDSYLDENEKAKALREKYVAHVERTMKLIGYNAKAAKQAAKDVMRIETDLAKVSKTREQRRDPKGLYNKVDRAGLAKLAPDFPWDAYFAGLGFPDIKDVNVTSTQFFEGLNAIVKATRPAEWSSYLQWHVVRSMSPALPKAFVDEAFSMEKEITGQAAQRDRWKRCVEATDSALGELLAQPFVDTHFGKESKQAVEQMVFAIRDAFGQELGKLDWMDPKTREKAQGKLKMMEYLIGFPAKWRSYDFDVDPKNYGKDLLAARAFEMKRRLGKVGKAVDRGEWQMSPPTVNAYYDPLKNHMVFPAGILQPPFYSPRSSVAVNMGGMGMVVGHEMTHGFDDEGSQFAGNGNLENWWDEGVRAKFDEKGACVAGQYGGYEALPGLKLKGKLTLGENIADIGGVKLAFLAYRSLRKDAKEVTVAGGFSEDQQFFLSVGQSWCSKYREEYARTAVQIDPHSPPRFRVNGSLADNPAFAQAFSCAAGTRMNPTDKCVVW
jgi:putative endopeptidase